MAMWFTFALISDIIRDMDLKIILYIVSAVIALAIIIGISVLFNKDDDVRLKIVFYIIVSIAIVAIIGIWEMLIKPLWNLLIGFIIP